MLSYTELQVSWFTIIFIPIVINLKIFIILQESQTPSLVRRILNPELNPQREAQFNSTKARIKKAIKMIQTDVAYENLVHFLDLLLIIHKKSKCFSNTLRCMHCGIRKFLASILMAYLMTWKDPILFWGVAFGKEELFLVRTSSTTFQQT